MTFINPQVQIDALPHFDVLELHVLHPYYARLVLGITLVIILPILTFVSVLLFVWLLPKNEIPLSLALIIFTPIFSFLSFLTWFIHKSARVFRYALRQHDVVVQSGVFWKKQIIQPIKRIQHVEQHQGPVDKKFGLYELKLFSAGTGHFTFSVPGLDADATTAIKQFVLSKQQLDWNDTENKNITGLSDSDND